MAWWIDETPPFPGDEEPSFGGTHRALRDGTVVAIDPATGYAKPAGPGDTPLGVAVAGSIALNGIVQIHLNKDFRPKYEDGLLRIAETYNPRRHPA